MFLVQLLQFCNYFTACYVSFCCNNFLSHIVITATLCSTCHTLQEFLVTRCNNYWMGRKQKSGTCRPWLGTQDPGPMTWDSRSKKRNKWPGFYDRKPWAKNSDTGPDICNHGLACEIVQFQHVFTVIYLYIFI